MAANACVAIIMLHRAIHSACTIMLPKIGGGGGGCVERGKHAQRFASSSRVGVVPFSLSWVDLIQDYEHARSFTESFPIPRKRHAITVENSSRYNNTAVVRMMAGENLPGIPIDNSLHTLYMSRKQNRRQPSKDVLAEATTISGSVQNQGWGYSNPSSWLSAPEPLIGTQAVLFKENKDQQQERMLVYGGEDELGKVRSETYVFNLRKDEWTNIITQSSPGPRVAHSMASFENQVYLFGGSYNVEMSSLTNGLFVYNSSSGWKVLYLEVLRQNNCRGID